MSVRAIVLLAIGMLVLGLLLGMLTGGAAGYFIGQSARPALAQTGASPVPAAPAPQVVIPRLPENVAPGLLPFQATNGARITYVEPDSPASKAGLQVGDVITAVGSDKVDAEHTLTDLIQAHKPGDKVTLAVRRDAKEMAIDVELGRSSTDSNTALLGVRATPAMTFKGIRRTQ